MLGDDNKPKKKKMQVLRTLNQRQLKQAMDEDASTNYEDEEDIMQVSATKKKKKIWKIIVTSRLDMYRDKSFSCKCFLTHTPTHTHTQQHTHTA